MQAMSDSALDSVIPRLRAIVAESMARHRIPGASVGVVRNGGLAWRAGFGTTALDRVSPPDEQTAYRVASITKTFTATAILQLREQALLDLDDPIVLHLPEFTAVISRHGPVEHVTLRRLMCHRSGLVSESAFDYWGSLKFPDRQTMLDRLPEAFIAIPPDSAWKYSNLGFALLGEVVARLSGKPYTRYIEDAILEPLGMASSGFEVADRASERLATGYSPVLGSDVPVEAPQTPLAGLTAAGQLYATVADLAKWLVFHMHGEQPGEATPTVLSPVSLREMHRIQYMEDGWKTGHCLAWRALRSGENIYINHGGSLPGFRSAILFNKRLRTGVIFLTNLGGHSAPEEAPVEMLDAIADAVDASPVETPPPEFAPMPDAYEPLLGIYESFEASLTSVVWRQGALRLAATSGRSRSLHAPAVLKPTAEARAFVVEGGRGAGELATFELGEDGSAASFRLGGAVYRRV